MKAEWFFGTAVTLVGVWFAAVASQHYDIPIVIPILVAFVVSAVVYFVCVAYKK